MSARSPTLVAIARFAERRPWAIIAAMVIAFAISLSALGVPIDFSFAGLMDRDQPEVARYFAASEAYGLGGLLPVLVEGPDDRLDELPESLAERWIGPGGEFLV